MPSISHVMTLSKNGQVSIPAEARARWGARKVVVVDLGDRVVMRPLGDEPIDDLRGKYRGRGPKHRPFTEAGSSGGRLSRPPALTILDAYAVLAYLKGEVAAPEVWGLLDGDASSLTALGVSEVLDHLVRIAGADEEDAALDVAQLGLLDGMPVDSEVGVAVGQLRARHYQRRRCEVSLADCVAADVARSRGEALATSDPHLLDVCHAERIAVIVLPGSNGTRWTPPA